MENGPWVLRPGCQGSAYNMEELLTAKLTLYLSIPGFRCQGYRSYGSVFWFRPGHRAIHTILRMSRPGSFTSALYCNMGTERCQLRMVPRSIAQIAILNVYIQYTKPYIMYPPYPVRYALYHGIWDRCTEYRVQSTESLSILVLRCQKTGEPRKCESLSVGVRAGKKTEQNE